MSAIQPEILAAVFRLTDSKARLVGVTKRWIALEELKKFNGGQSYHGSEPNY